MMVSSAYPQMLNPLVRLRILVVLLLALLSTAASAESPAWILPPGQDALAEAMLTAPPGWELVGAQLQQDQILATYRKDGKDALVRLQHPETAPQAPHTARFALTGDAPPALIAALQVQIAAKEANWQWRKPGKDKADPVVPATANPATAVTKAVEAATAAIDGSRPAEALQLLGKALELTPGLDPVERQATELALAWRLQALHDARAEALFRRHLADPDPLLAQSANLGVGTQPPAACPTVLPQACTQATQIAEDWRIGGQAMPALKLLRCVVQGQPTCTSAVTTAARIAQRSGRPQDAMALLDEALTRQPGDVELTVLAANLQRQQGNLADALRRVETLDLARVPPGELVALDLARILIDTAGGEPVAGGEAYVQKLRAQSDANPSDAVAAFLVGTVLHHRQEWQESNRYLQRSAKGFVAEPRQYLYAAMNEWHLGNQARAEELVARAMQLPRQDPDDWYCRAMIVARHDPAQALADLQRYLDVTGTTADNSPMKKVKVQKYMADLTACREAGNIGRCLDLRAAHHEFDKHQLSYLAGLLALLGLGVGLWRWRRKSKLMLGLLLLPGALLLPTLAHATPTAIEAQVSSMTDLELAQVGVDASLLAASVVFFSRLPSPSSASSASCSPGNGSSPGA
jgi:tetratricopeptide (TPR) repeat protein